MHKQPPFLSFPRLVHWQEVEGDGTSPYKSLGKHQTSINSMQLVKYIQNFGWL